MSEILYYIYMISGAKRQALAPKAPHGGHKGFCISAGIYRSITSAYTAVSRDQCYVVVSHFRHETAAQNALSWQRTLRSMHTNSILCDAMLVQYGMSSHDAK